MRLLHFRALAKNVACWREIVPPSIARHCRRRLACANHRLGGEIREYRRRCRYKKSYVDVSLSLLLSGVKGGAYLLLLGGTAPAR